MRVEGCPSDGGLLSSGVLLGAVLGSLLSLMYVSDPANGSGNPGPMFVDELKLLGSAYSETIQKDLDKVYQRSVKWGLPLSLSKCNGPRKEKQMPLPPGHQIMMEHTQEARDLGIVVSTELNPRLQCLKAAKKTWCALRKLKNTAGFRRPIVLLMLSRHLSNRT